MEDDDGVGGDASRERAERGEWESPHLDYERERAMDMGTIKYPSSRRDLIGLGPFIWGLSFVPINGACFTNGPDLGPIHSGSESA